MSDSIDNKTVEDKVFETLDLQIYALEKCRNLFNDIEIAENLGVVELLKDYKQRISGYKEKGAVIDGMTDLDVEYRGLFIECSYFMMDFAADRQLRVQHAVMAGKDEKPA